MSKSSRIAFGQALKKLREDRNLTQKRFALMINMDRSYYAQVESGERNVSFDNIEKIAEGLQVSLSDLFQNIGIQYDEVPVSHKGGQSSRGKETRWVSL